MKTFNPPLLSGYKLLALFILTNVVYALMLLVTIPAVIKFTGGQPLPDMMPTGYDATYLRALLVAMGQEGRQAYLCRQLPLDFLYPGLFALTYSLLWVWLLHRLHRAQSPLLYIGLLPLLAGLCDYAENLFFVLFLQQYPVLTDGSAKLAACFSVGKSLSTTLFFILLLLGLLAWGLQRLRR